MPELPEVETIRRTLQPHLVGQTVTAVRVYRPQQLQNITSAELGRRLTGKKIEELGRRGKYLLFFLENQEVLVVHLRMTGRLLFYSEGVAVTPYTRLVLGLTPPAELHLHDVRSFAMVFLTTQAELPSLSGLASLGPEPFSPDFTPQELSAALAAHRGPIKNVLLAQRVVAGLGNIYADEALFQAGINPLRPANSLTAEEAARLFAGIRAVLKKAIAAGGTSIRDYVNGHGVPGSFQLQLAAYGRKGEPCRQCGTPLVGRRLGGRSTVFCPRCQPLAQG
ncbi:MAG TPA: bifunctional DNA-formamidopyrimidine glycosylase/DNA-(apurinic or apyrimidinic site) lyase [Firmicutes bacterium]|nr:bifunctional DNA-formamidopyrimidine glycosylase/DNA-(apurinic or apyrimidinic site) lyase [Bacillota bacterium]